MSRTWEDQDQEDHVSDDDGGGGDGGDGHHHVDDLRKKDDDIIVLISHFLRLVHSNEKDDFDQGDDFDNQVVDLIENIDFDVDDVVASDDEGDDIDDEVNFIIMMTIFLQGTTSLRTTTLIERRSQLTRRWPACSLGPADTDRSFSLVSYHHDLHDLHDHHHHHDHHGLHDHQHHHDHQDHHDHLDLHHHHDHQVPLELVVTS